MDELQDWEMLETTSSTTTDPFSIIIHSDHFNIIKQVSSTDEKDEEGGHASVLQEVRGSVGEVGSEVCAETSEIQHVEEEQSGNTNSDEVLLESKDDAHVMESLGDGGGEVEEEGSGGVIQGRGGEERSVGVWWKVPVELLKFCVFRISPVWTFSIAAAVMGLILLKRRLSRMSRQSRSIPIKLTVEDKKVSQMRAARLNEAFSVVRYVPIVRPLLPSSGATPWLVLNIR